MSSETAPLLKFTTSECSKEIKTRVFIERPLYKQEDLHRATRYEEPNEQGSFCVPSCNFPTCIRRFLPAFQWLPYYQLSTDLLADVISGLTVAVMHIPQGMAYGLLGNLPPVFGIYMAFFPVLVYFFFTTSRHASMGAIGIVCLMTGKVVSQYSNEELTGNSIIKNASNDTRDHRIEQYTNVEIATTVTFTVGTIQIFLYIFRIGTLSSLLSSTLVNGFTTGAGIHIILSQLKDLLGINIPRRIGIFKNGYIVYDAILAIPEANHVAIIISASAMLLMTLNNKHLKPWLSKRTKIPIPIELITICFGTFFSYLIDLKEKYNVTLVGDIPIGLPEAAIPQFSLIPKVALDSLTIAIVSYSITLSMSLIIAQKISYEIDTNQEFLAMGAGNLFGSFFGCMPFSASLSRSLIQQVTGGVTQIASLVSCAILLVLLLWVGPIFQFLPRINNHLIVYCLVLYDIFLFQCILASIIVVALKGIFMQAKDLIKFWRLSKMDAMVWLVTFIGVVFLDIEIGLAAGVIASLVVISVQSFKPYTCLLGHVPDTDFFLDIRRYRGIEEIDNIKIFHYSGGLNFASRTMFKNEVCKRINVNPSKIIMERKRREKLGKSFRDDHEILTVKCLIIDLSALNYIDPEGVEQLRIIANEFNQIGVHMYLASASGPVYEMLQKCDMYEKKKGNYYIFPTIHDAVLFAKENIFHIKDK